MDGPIGPSAPKRNQPLLWSGVAAVVVGSLLLLYGAWPLGYTLELLKGPGGDPQAVEGNVEEMMAEAKARVWADVAGFVLLMAGMAMVPASKPKPKPVEELVEEALQRRAASGMPPPPIVDAPRANVPARAPPARPTLAAPVTPAPAAPATPVPPTPASSHAPLPRCTTCGSLLVAGGRICPKGHA